jgi:NitT/TauT family transport system ATP-binding protein
MAWLCPENFIRRWFQFCQLEFPVTALNFPVTHQIDEAVFLSDRVLVFARRPGRLQESIDIRLPRPRGLDIKRQPEFVSYVDHIWRLIENDVRVSVINEHG